ncbi:FAD:protein FMN transferase [Martelella mediterranea]|uniref:FAD:protein FMN transferase n=1 Tax=Martelella mediterranea TaxID=293089 RepID=UPI001E535D6D|nr:FAD:protein FMN transferase [Martelella mediterranea]MCD1632712.1 FAD:protein FMN transferase [Martelella mediterranea]
MTAHLTRRHLLAAAGAAGCALAGPGLLRAAPAARHVTGMAFASDWSITLADNADAAGLKQRFDRLLAGIDRMMSPWRADSEITGFNTEKGETARISAETAFTAEAALAMASESDGWFDPTIGPIVARYGFGPIEGNVGPEDGAAPRWRALVVEGDRLVKRAPGLTMDLCGIAKGRALDLMALELRKGGHEDFLIAISGELLASGRHPEGRPWQVAVEDPRIEANGAFGVLGLDNAAIATSGLRAQSYDLGGTRYSHIIDPYSARPVEGAIASVSVIAPDAMTADGWATALTAAGAEGPTLAKSRGISALFLFHDGTGLRSESVNGFDRFLL